MVTDARVVRGGPAGHRARRACSSAGRAAPRCTPRSSSARELGPDAIVVVLLPDSGRGYLSKIFNDEWMTDFGFLRSDGPDRGRRARGQGRLDPGPRARHARRRRRATRSRCMRDARRLAGGRRGEQGAAARGDGGDRARSTSCSLMDQAFRDPRCSTGRSREVMGPALPMVGIGETVDRRRRAARVRHSRCSCSTAATRSASLTRSDVLAFLGRPRRPLVSDATWTTASRPAPSTPARPPDPATGAVVTPITPLDDVRPGRGRASTPGFEYARTRQPDPRARSRSASPSLEGATHGLAFASGMAAEDAVLRPARARRPRGPPRRRLRRHVPPGVEGARARRASSWTVGRPHRPRRARATTWPDGTALVWVETPTNPALTIVDIAAVAAVAHARGARVVVDNTFATPYLQRPLALGADIVVHSTTKYLGGHSDVVGGFVATTDAELAERLGFLQNAVGAVPSPFDCYLVLRGIKTLAVRMDRHCDNARRSSRCCCAHPAVDRVLYPGLPIHPGHEIARPPDARLRRDGELPRRRRRGRGARAGRRAPACSRWPSRSAAVESLIEHPARMTHASAADSPLAVDPALLRLSVGIETHRRPRRRPPPGARRGLERRRAPPLTLP